MNRLTEYHNGVAVIKNKDFKAAAEKLAFYEELFEAGLLQFPRPELNDCEKCGAVGNFGDCIFFGYGRTTFKLCKNSMAELLGGGSDE